ncbi:hypothetical protein FACS1894208_01860 [Clostridia bacterium]|nr:hypothetical protein FACS1894208_01860 [Clostridia bacterium]
MSTRTEIIHSAIDCFFEKGIVKTTYAEIAAIVGIKRQGVMYYFPNKEAIVLEMFVLMEKLFAERLQMAETTENLNVDEFLDRLFAIFTSENDCTYFKLLHIIFSNKSQCDITREYILEHFMVRFHDYLANALRVMAAPNNSESKVSASRILFRILFTYTSGSILTGSTTEDKDFKLCREDCRFIIEMLLSGNISA